LKEIHDAKSLTNDDKELLTVMHGLIELASN